VTRMMVVPGIDYLNKKPRKIVKNSSELDLRFSVQSWFWCPPM
jgi:hypothetical protein